MLVKKAGDPGGGAYPSSLRPPPSVLRQGRRRFLVCVGRSQLTTCPQGKQVLALVLRVHLGAQLAEPVTSGSQGTPGLQNHPLWAGTWHLHFETLPGGSQVARLACGLPSRNWSAQEAGGRGLSDGS